MGFKVGDRVRCIDADRSEGRLCLGQIYTISAAGKSYAGVAEVADTDWYATRFERAESTEERDLRLSMDPAAMKAQVMRDMKERKALIRDEKNDALRNAVLTYLRRAEAQLQAAEGQIAEALRLRRDK